MHFIYQAISGQELLLVVFISLRLHSQNKE